MPELGVLWCNIKCSIIIPMCCSKVLVRIPIQENVSTIEIDSRVIGVFLNSIIKILLSIFLSIDVVISQSFVVEMHCGSIKTNSLLVMNQCIFKFSLFEVRKTQVVVCTCSIVLHFDGFLKVFNRFI